MLLVLKYFSEICFTLVGTGTEGMGVNDGMLFVIESAIRARLRTCSTRDNGMHYHIEFRKHIRRYLQLFYDLRSKISKLTFRIIKFVRL